MANFIYKWHKYHLNVSCDKCNHPIPFQSFDGHPSCEECGHVSDVTWTDTVEFSKIDKVKRYEEGSTQLGGFMSVQMEYKKVDSITCFHCHHALNVPAQEPAVSVECEECHQILSFVVQPAAALQELIFYFHKNEKETLQGNIIAVRCASCGAPLQADNTKNEYTCNFCSTLNIIPPSFRAKKVLDDVYVGWRSHVISIR